MVLLTSGAKAESIANLIVTEAIKQEFSIELALAVAKVESNFNPNAIGTRGEKGLFQIMHFNAPKAELFDPKENARIGISLLKQFKDKCKDMGPYWIICFNNGVNRRPKHPHLHPYYLKIAKAM